MKTLKARLQERVSPPWAFGIALGIVLAAAYGLQIGRLGFYWDDWQVIFLAGQAHWSTLWTYYLSDRPLSIWTYLLTLPLLGVHPLRWQLFTLLLRALSALGLWAALRGIWPRYGRAVGWAALLFAVYPGFSQQSISVAYSQHFLAYALFTGSLACMVAAVRQPRRAGLYTPLALLFALLQGLTMEYFLGLELLRPLLLWLLLRPTDGKKGALRAALLRWLPYALVLVLIAIWRFLIFPRISPDPTANAPLLLLNLRLDPVGQMLRLLQIMLQDITHLTLFAWLNPILPQTIDLGVRFTVFSWFVGLLTALLAAWLLRDAPAEAPDEARFARQMMAVGLLALLLGGFPVWSTDRQVLVGMWSDRFALGPMLGACLLLVGGVVALTPRRLGQGLVLGAVLALAISAQMRTSDQYAQNWRAQRDYYWQLNWRAPALKPGTVVLGPKFPFGLVADYSIGFALNTIYAPDLRGFSAPYWFVSAISRRGGLIEDFRDGLPIRDDLRTVTYQGSTSQGLVVRYKYGQSCLRVMSKADRYLPLLSDDERELLAISHLDQIETNPARAVQPSAAVFGPEPAHGWCYLYQKADLAAQQQDWAAVMDLYQAAQQQNLTPNNGVEWTPFIQAFAQRGDWQQAGQLTQQSRMLTGDLPPYLCHVWSGLMQQTPDSPERAAAWAAQQAALGCEP